MYDLLLVKRSPQFPNKDLAIFRVESLPKTVCRFYNTLINFRESRKNTNQPMVQSHFCFPFQKMWETSTKFYQGKFQLTISESINFHSS